ncbi:MAG: tRNA (guanosine(37)-N1)-methyltransferase TrmD [bacterium]|nr:tRNA (guanosine(37)-N1)-methyltransferase TrmD [bacterium]
MKIDVITLFPEAFNPLDLSIVSRAKKQGLLEINLHNLYGFTENKHKKVDDYPYGGGPGMVIRPEPLHLAIKSLMPGYIIYLTPQGSLLTQELAKDLVEKDHLIFICGHYEGIDERVIERFVDLELSVGDFVTTGGEIPCLLVIDVVARLIPGVLGNPESIESESFSNGYLEGPQYTRPSEFEGMKVPEILLSGDHKKIKEWRKEKALEKTRKNRPDLIERRKYLGGEE